MTCNNESDNQKLNSKTLGGASGSARILKLRREEFIKLAEESLVAFRQAAEALSELRVILCDQTLDSQEAEKECEGKVSIGPPQ